MDFRLRTLHTSVYVPSTVQYLNFDILDVSPTAYTPSLDVVRRSNWERPQTSADAKTQKGRKIKNFLVFPYCTFNNHLLDMLFSNMHLLHGYSQMPIHHLFKRKLKTLGIEKNYTCINYMCHSLDKRRDSTAH